MERTKPNVVWITLDSVRADHTTLAGYERNTTPCLQDIADRPGGAYYPNCIAHARYTLPSTASILTGVTPSRHRMGFERKTASPSLPSVPELFSTQGYRTDCVSVNDFISEETGLDRGFDQFDLLEPRTIHHTAGITTLLKFLIGIRHHSAGFQTDLRKHATAWLLTAILKRRLRAHGNSADPVFLYAHYNETHMPYYPPLSYIDEYTDETSLTGREGGDLAIDIVDSLNETIAHGCDLTPDEWSALIGMYDAELRFTDSCVGEVFDSVEKHLDDTIFIVTADHGEFLGEYGLIGHKCILDNTLLNVPLITHGLANVDTENLVQHTDLMATLLSISGGNPAPIQGIDLRTDTRQYAISQDGPGSLDRFVRINEDFDVPRFSEGEITTIQDGRYKLTVTEEGTSLFTLPSEEPIPKEKHLDVADRLETAVRSWLETSGTPIDATKSDTEYSDQMKNRLTKLGYIDGEL